MASSKVEVCNLALSLISQEAVVDIDAPKSNNEVICAKWYEQSRRKALSSHPWNFAQRMALAPQTTVPAFGYEQAFQLPADYLRIVQIGNTRETFVTNFTNYKIIYENDVNTIQINFEGNGGGTGSLPIIYMKNEIIVLRFSPWFVDYMAHELALMISPEINRTASEIQTLEGQTLKSLTLAKQLEGQESPIITVTNSKYRTGVTNNQVIRFTN